MRKYYLLGVLMLCCALQLLGQSYNWSNVAMGGGGFVSGIITSKTQPGLIYARTDVGGAYRWDAVNSKWISLLDLANENQQGYMGVLSMATDTKSPNIVYMAVGISYFNSGNSYILRSADQGATFTTVNVTTQFKINGNANGREDGERLQVDPVNSAVLYYGSQANGLFQSANSGSTWTRLNGLNVTATNNGNGINFIVPDTSSTTTMNGTRQTQRIFAGISRMGNQNLYRSDDGGVTFTPLPNPNIADTTQMPHRAVLGNGYLYVTYANGGGPGATTAEPCNTGVIWRYTIATGVWANITPVISGGLVNKPYCGISIDPGDPNRLIVSTTNNYSYQYVYQGSNIYGDKIYYSTDGGATWTDVVSRGFNLNPNGIPWIAGQSIHWGGSIQFDPSNTNRVFINSGNGVFINNDITAAAGTWNFAAQGIEETVPQNLVSIPGGPVISVISDYDGFTQVDPSQYGSNRHTPTMGSTSGLDYAATNKKVARVASSIYYSTDMGVSWTKTNVINGSSGQIALSADGNTYLHCPSGSATTYRSTDNGTTWTAVTGLSISGARPVADGSNPAKFYAYDGTGGNLMISTDGGVSFSAAANAAGTGGSKVIRTIPGREGSVWIALYNGGLAYTDNGGATAFTKLSNVTYCEAVGIGKALTAGTYETIYIWGTVGGVSGLYRSTDKGGTWIRVNDDNHQYGGPANGQFVVGDMNTYGRVYLSTAGRGVAYGTPVPAQTPTDITLSVNTIVQNNTIGAVIGALSSVATDPAATFTYTLVAGTGSTDNTSFSISGNQLQAAVIFNYNAKQAYNIRIRTTSSGGQIFEKAFVINIQNIYTLPITNFTVSASSVTCIGNNDGKIDITAVQALNYTAVVTYNGATTNYLFTTGLDIPSLVPGSYSVCITVAGQPTYSQCYDLTVAQPKPLSVYASVDVPGKNIVLNLSGATSYNIQLNGSTITTSSGNVTLSLAEGPNDLVVSTDKSCQGVYTQHVFIGDTKRFYPNPFDSILYVNMANDISRLVNVNVYTTSGVLVYSQQLAAHDSTVQADLSALKSGVYVIKIRSDSGESSSKIIKK